MILIDQLRARDKRSVILICFLISEISKNGIRKELGLKEPSGPYNLYHFSQ